ncbi:MAG TPA: hypothetical protein ENN67_05615 [Firmicutes bacterium]|nr:hypothetical protein [Bacillota bacterium]
MGDATEIVDQFIVNYEPATLMTWLFIAAIVIGVISLGTEFWTNLWGIIFYPALTFQRILGEAQTVPGIVVVLVSGAASGAITLAYILDPPIREMIIGIDVSSGAALSQLVLSTDDILSQAGWDSSIEGVISYMQGHVFQWWIFAVLIPLNALLVWFLMGLAGQVASMLAGNKAGQGVTNLWSAVPYMFLVNVPITWFFWMSRYEHPFVRFMLVLSCAWYVFLFVIMMREHGRYNISKAIMATILTPILTAIFWYLSIVLGIIIYAYAAQYI